MLSFTVLALFATAQNAIKNVFIETYYITDAKDASDTTGGKIEAGFKTYRIYVQMKPGCKLLSIYGDHDHALKISSTSEVFNNTDFGKSFGKDFNKSNYGRNTVALDSWLTLGQTTKKSAITYFGVPKSMDHNGSFIGGANNDGGSSSVPGGVLTNTDPLAGIPLTIADGMDTMPKSSVISNNWVQHGFLDPISGEDSTIFGSIKRGNSFVSYDAYLTNSGVMGVNADSNMVLLGQITTKGQISFELNLQVSDPGVDPSYSNFYVAKGLDSTYTGLHKIITMSPYLKYPPACGCNDPNFLEYNKKYVCSSSDSCKTRIILGCMDPTACNYDPAANYNVKFLCCYPGLCHDRDLSKACPLNGEPVLRLDVFPNPTKDQLVVHTTTAIDSKETKVIIYDYFGKVVFEKNLGVVSGTLSNNLDLSNFQKGIYLVRLFVGTDTDSRMFIKE